MSYGARGGFLDDDSDRTRGGGFLDDHDVFGASEDELDEMLAEYDEEEDDYEDDYDVWDEDDEYDDEEEDDEEEETESFGAAPPPSRPFPATLLYDEEIYPLAQRGGFAGDQERSGFVDESY